MLLPLGAHLVAAVLVMHGSYPNKFEVHTRSGDSMKVKCGARTSVEGWQEARYLWWQAHLLVPVRVAMCFVQPHLVVGGCADTTAWL